MKDIEVIKQYNGAIILNLTQHQMTPEQYEYNGVKLKELYFEIKEEQKKKKIYTINISKKE